MINTAVIMGRLVADPELRHTPSDLAVTSFTVAVDRAYSRSNANGERERQTDFIDVVAWRSTAEFVCRYFRKGQMIALDGSIQTRSYTDKDGNKRTAFEVLVNNIYFADSKKETAPQSNTSTFTFPENFEPGTSIDVDVDDLPF